MYPYGKEVFMLQCFIRDIKQKKNPIIIGHDYVVMSRDQWKKLNVGKGEFHTVGIDEPIEPR